MTTPIHDRLLEPVLPYDMRPRVRAALQDIPLQLFVGQTTRTKHAGRESACHEAFGSRYDDVRRLAGEIKQHALDHLDVYLERFIDNATAAGVQMHYASAAAEARALGVEIATARGCRLCVKSKSMVTEEIGLLPALADAGIDTLETDLGEFIIQLDGDAPSHIVAPMIHKNRAAVARAFERELGATYTEDPAKLTAIARDHMRGLYRRADLGISGANFLVSDTGAIVLCTNEGNGDLAVSLPPVHIVYAGIEKIVPRLEDLPVLLKLLSRSATAQPLTVYTTFINGPRRKHEVDGPHEVHIILVDNGRTGILREPTRELLRCIRCGACLNACPVFRKVGGGHAYGAVYSGPIGATITPLLKGLANYPDLPQVSSLCGACGTACPVHIDLPGHLVRLRQEQVDHHVLRRWTRWGYRLWAMCLKHPRWYHLTSGVLRWGLRCVARDRVTRRWWCRRLPGVLSGWTQSRDFPAPADQPFRSWWRARQELP